MRYKSPGPCLVCGSRSAREILDGTPGRIVRCPVCRFVFQDPQPDPQELVATYRSDRYFALGAVSGIGYADYVADEPMYRRYFAAKAGALARFVRPGRLFEIGCAAGFFLDEARRRGWEVSGSELSPAAAHYARETLGLDVRTAGVEDLAAAEPRYDTVAALQTIEHVPEPAAMVEWMRSSVPPGGLVLLTTPDVSSRIARVLGRRWPSYRPEHLWYFDRETLRRLVEGAGMTVLSVRGDDPLLVPVHRIVERLRHYFGLRLAAPRALSSLAVPVWLGDLELIARRDR